MLRDKEVSLDGISAELKKKYPLYEFSFLKNDDKENTVMYNFTAGGAQRLEIPLPELSEEDKKDQGLLLYIIPETNNQKIGETIEYLKKLTSKLNSFDSKKNLPIIRAKDNLEDQKVFNRVFNEFWDLFRAEDPDKWEEIEKHLTLVAYNVNKSSIALHGWHTIQPIDVMIERCLPSTPDCSLAKAASHFDIGTNSDKKWTMYEYPNSTSGVAFANLIEFGFLFNFKPDSIPCVHGRIIYLSFDNSLPFCLCDYGYGGDECDIPLKKNPDDQLMSSMSSISENYKVPGMFDLQDQIDTQTDKLMQEMSDNKQEIFSEIRGINAGIEKNKNAIMSAQSVILNEMKSQTSAVLNEFSNLNAAFELAMEKERNDRIYRSEKAVSEVVNTIVVTAQEITDALVSLDKKTVENRYFDELSLHIPVFQRLFLHATMEGSSDGLKEDFSEYLYLHKHYFYVSREAVTHAIAGKPDSYLRAQMNGYMVSGCTEEYNSQIKSAWSMLMHLHSSTYVMEDWYLDYRLKHAQLIGDQDEVATINQEIAYIDEQSRIESSMFKKIYHSSCPPFTMDELLGGGCKEGFTYPGQEIVLQCIDEGMNVVRKSTGKALTHIQCDENSEWSLDITDLMCAPSCEHDGTKYPIGETRKLPSPRDGFRWVNSKTEAITEIVCEFSSTDNAAKWPFFEESDINECSEGIVNCKPHGFCTNDKGTYSCNCGSGFIENPTTGCEDVNECTVGGTGSTACLVSRNLGVCNNKVGGYECFCLPGAYSPGESKGLECKACTCAEGGVTARHCDEKTGKCICKINVVGEDCGACATAYTNFPYCNKCAPGYRGYPRCRKCNCEEEGTTDDICNRKNGRCICNPWANGRRCGRCCPAKNCEDAYEPFPDCTPIVKDGTPTDWSKWSEWTDLGKCESSGIHQERTRSRTCNDKTKNRHGKSCMTDKLEEKESRYLKACEQVTQYFFYTRCGMWDGTSGKLRFNIRQDNRECETYKKTFDKASKCKGKEVKGTQGCDLRFDTRKPLQLRMMSDSGDDVNLESFGIMVKNIAYYWTNDGSNPSVNENTDKWYTLQPVEWGQPNKIPGWP